MKTSLRSTLAATALAVASIANLASLPSAALTVAAGLVVSGDALAGGAPASDAVVLQTKPIAGVGIRCCKRPGGSTARCIAPPKTGADGSFQLSGLEAGEYDVTPDGMKPAIFKVGADGKLSGVVRASGVVQTSTGALPANAVDKGIKDSKVKGCGNCGLTSGKVAEPSAGVAETKASAQ
jgi:hypothetical protein